MGLKSKKITIMISDYNTYTKIQQHILDNELLTSIELMKKLANETGNVSISEELENQLNIYTQMLLFTFSDANDPQRSKIYTTLKKKLLHINDTLIEKIKNTDNNSVLAYEKKTFLRKALQSQISIAHIFQSYRTADQKLRKQLFEHLFMFIWFTDNFKEADADILNKILLSGRTEFYEKSLIVSAITLSLLRYFDLKKFELLFNAYDTNAKYVWNRAMVGLVFAFCVYDKRIKVYEELKEKLNTIVEDKGFENYIQMIVFQLIRTRETEKISEKFRNEIIPEMTKMQPYIEEKLDLDKILSDNFMEDENPDWEKLFEDSSDLLNKIEEISKMQMEGSDVFLSAFSQLKHFDFFNSSANWFLPFHKENTEIKQIFKSTDAELDVETFVEGLQKVVYICNSDKYSFCFNIGMMPEMQQKMVVNMFKAEAETMREIAEEDQMFNKDIENKHIFTRYIQDIYRFYTLSKFKNDLKDIFDSEFYIENTYLFKILNKNPKIIRRIAEFFMQKTYYSSAIETYFKLSDDEKAKKRGYEKIAFAYQKLKIFDKALKYYKLAELFNSNSVWLNKKIGFCSRKVGDYENALLYYEKAEVQQPDNLHIIANKGHCYLAAERYEEALQTYFKVEYFEPNNVYVKRPLAWCSFVLGKFDSAKKYIKSLIAENSSPHDFINLGHVYFCKNKKALSVKTYKKALEKITFSDFKKTLLNDKPHLLKHGVAEEDIYLLLDYLRQNPQTGD